MLSFSWSALKVSRQQPSGKRRFVAYTPRKHVATHPCCQGNSNCPSKF